MHDDYQLPALSDLWSKVHGKHDAPCVEGASRREMVDGRPVFAEVTHGQKIEALLGLYDRFVADVERSRKHCQGNAVIHRGGGVRFAGGA